MAKKNRIGKFRGFVAKEKLEGHGRPIVTKQIFRHTDRKVIANERFKCKTERVQRKLGLVGMQTIENRDVSRNLATMGQTAGYRFVPGEARDQFTVTEAESEGHLYSAGSRIHRIAVRDCRVSRVPCWNAVVSLCIMPPASDLTANSSWLESVNHCLEPRGVGG